MQNEKVIKSNIVKTVAAYVIGISCLLLGAWWTISTLGHRSNTLLLGLIFIGFGLYLTGDTLTAVQEIILKPEKMIVIGSFSKEELTHEQIRSINLSSMRQYRRQFRRKIIKLVVIHPVSGGSITLNNRLGRPEFLYDTLMSWWEKPNKKDKSGGMVYGNEPPPTQFTEVGRSDHEQRENGLPNLLIPENEQMLARMKQINVYHGLIVPFSWDKVNDNRVHSDCSGVLMDAASSLPVNSKFVVYGFPALVHPTTGMIFGCAMGMSVWYRLPDTVAREYREYMDKKYAHFRSSKKKPAKESAPINTLPPLESNWVNELSFTTSFLHKIYEFYSGRQPQSSGMHLNIAEDLRKEPPPPPFYASCLGRLFSGLVLFGFFLVAMLIRDSMAGFRLVRQILDFLQQR